MRMPAEKEVIMSQELLKLMEERHSVRAYQNKSIEPEKVEALKQEVARVNEASGLHIQFLDNLNNVFGSLMLKAIGWKNVPAYFAMIGPQSDDLDQRCGYYGEQLVLFAQGLGLNTCWAGMAKSNRVDAALENGEKYVIAIAVGYGVNGGKPRKSKSIEDVTDVSPQTMPAWFKTGIEYALLAPTAINQQKFRFSLDEQGNAHITASSNGPFVELDLGIVAYHFETASGHSLNLF